MWCLLALTACAVESFQTPEEYANYVDGLGLANKPISDAIAILKKEGFDCGATKLLTIGSAVSCERVINGKLCAQDQTINLAPTKDPNATQVTHRVKKDC